MKVCVCSDSHGNPEGIARMLEQEKPDALIFLGDGVRDFLQVSLPEGMPFFAVAGNCDMACLEPPYRVFELLGRRFYITHGHSELVKMGLDQLAERAMARQADVALYGHTHMNDAKNMMGMLMLNPGAMKDRENRYAVLWEEAGQLRYAFKMVDWQA